MTPISKSQIKFIWSLAGERGISKEDLYELIYQVADGQEHISKLNKEQANRVIHRLHGRKPTPFGMITASQEAYIKDLARQLGWHTNKRRLNGFIRKYAKVEDVSWLTIRQASNVIEGLKRQVKAQEEQKEVNAE